MRYLFMLLCCLPGLLPGQDFVVEKLPEFINSGADEITPVISRDGNTIFFTRVAYPEFDHTLWLDSIDYAQKLQPDAYNKMLGRIYSELAKTTIRDPERSAFNQDVWIASGDSAFFEVLEHPGPPLNNALPNSIVSITPDPNAFYTINQFKPAGDMKKGFSLVQRQANGEWSFPVPVEIKDYYTIKSDVSLTMSFDGQILILAAARYDSRDIDLYVCFQEGMHQWSAPLHLGNVINSGKRELTPFLSEDHRTLFFASDRWNSTGGLDLFMSRREDESWTRWSEPIRMTQPINSVADESQPYFNMTTGYLYFTSRRDGSNDIFRTRIAPPQPTVLTIKGRILNRENQQLVTDARVRYGSAGGSDNIVTSEHGYYSLQIPKGVEFQLTPEYPGLSGIPETAFFRRDYYYFQEYYTIDLYMEPLREGSRIALRPIYFQQSKAIILETSLPELKRLASILQANPGMSIRVEGHTDNIGNPVDLQQLSEARAEAIKQALIDYGIENTRITTIGFGGTKSINDNSTDELRQQNRRVEIHITKI